MIYLQSIVAFPEISIPELRLTTIGTGAGSVINSTSVLCLIQFTSAHSQQFIYVCSERIWDFILRMADCFLFERKWNTNQKEASEKKKIFQSRIWWFDLFLFSKHKRVIYESILSVWPNKPLCILITNWARQTTTDSNIQLVFFLSFWIKRIFIWNIDYMKRKCNAIRINYQ